jgi:hypothetical protein
MIKERILPFTKGFWSILLSQSCDGIYWMWFFHDKRTNWPLRKAPGRFYYHRIVMIFIVWKLFQHKRTNLSVYE